MLRSDQPVTAAEVVAELTRRGTRAQIAELDRYGITAHRPFGVTVGELKGLAKSVGRDHALAQDLWATGRYEARMLAAMVDEPDRVTLRQMDAWSADFDSWAIVDTVCMHLFDRTPYAWRKAEQWSRSRPEFRKRAAFALIWALSVHDKQASDSAFERGLELIEQGADDERKYVKKAVNMALRAVGKRNRALNQAATRTARRLTKREGATPTWIGGHALRELTSAKVQTRL